MPVAAPLFKKRQATTLNIKEVISCPNFLLSHHAESITRQIEQVLADPEFCRTRDSMVLDFSEIRYYASRAIHALILGLNALISQHKFEGFMVEGMNPLGYALAQHVLEQQIILNTYIHVHVQDEFSRGAAI